MEEITWKEAFERMKVASANPDAGFTVCFYPYNSTKGEASGS